MRITESARRHGVEEADILHAFAVAVRSIAHGDDGKHLVIGGGLAFTTTSQGDLMPPVERRDVEAPPVGLSTPEAEHATEMAWLDNLDVEVTPADHTDDLARVGAAALRLAEDERTLEEAIHDARERGRSWTEIALRLGVSRQAARQRYSGAVG